MANMYRYAQVDENNICIGMAESSNPITGAMFIPCDKIVTGQQYIDGEWVECVPVPKELSDMEKLQAELSEIKEQNLILMEALADLGGGM